MARILKIRSSVHERNLRSYLKRERLPSEMQPGISFKGTPAILAKCFSRIKSESRSARESFALLSCTTRQTVSQKAAIWLRKKGLRLLFGQALDSTRCCMSRTMVPYDGIAAYRRTQLCTQLCVEQLPVATHLPARHCSIFSLRYIERNLKLKRKAVKNRKS